MKLFGKSRKEIEELTRRKSRTELLDLLWRHCSLEPFFSPAEIAKACGMAPQTVKQKMIAGEIAAHLPAVNRYRASLSAVARWHDATALSLGQSNGETFSR